MITGTNHFVSLSSALEYYGDYGYNRKDVDAKIRDGEIVIGKPELKPTEALLIIDEGKRYAIEG